MVTHFEKHRLSELSKGDSGRIAARSRLRGREDSEVVTSTSRSLFGSRARAQGRALETPRADKYCRTNWSMTEANSESAAAR